MNTIHLKHDLERRGVRFVVGQDSTGRWIVSSRDGLLSGVFPDRAAAVQFAMFESVHMPGAVLCVAEEIPMSFLKTSDSLSHKTDSTLSKIPDH